MDKTVHFFRKVFHILFFLAGVSLALMYEKQIDMMIQNMELEMVWRYLADSGH